MFLLRRYELVFIIIDQYSKCHHWYHYSGKAREGTKHKTSGMPHRFSPTNNGKMLKMLDEKACSSAVI